MIFRDVEDAICLTLEEYDARVRDLYKCLELARWEYTVERDIYDMGVESGLSYAYYIFTQKNPRYHTPQKGLH